MATNVIIPSNLNSPDFEIGTRVAGKVTINGNIYVDATVDSVAKTLTLTKLDGTTTVLSLAAFDIYVDDLATAYDATANVLTLKQTSGGPDVVIDLNDLQKAAVENGNGTAFSGDGTDASPLHVDVVVDPASDPSLTVSATGVKLDPALLVLPVEVQDTFGTPLYRAGNP